MTYLNNVRSDVQGRFFDLLDRNTALQNSFERVKNENILLKVELSQYKLFNLSLDPSKSTEISMGVFNVDLENLNSELVTVKEQKEKLTKELALANAHKQSPRITPKWIEKAQSKRTEGLGFYYKRNNGKKKNYVELPSVKVCSFCGTGDHVVTECSKKKELFNKNQNIVKKIWIKKDDPLVEKELEETRVPVSNN